MGMEVVARQQQESSEQGSEWSGEEGGPMTGGKDLGKTKETQTDPEGDGKGKQEQNCHRMGHIPSKWGRRGAAGGVCGSMRAEQAPKREIISRAAARSMQLLVHSGMDEPTMADGWIVRNSSASLTFAWTGFKPLIA